MIDRHYGHLARDGREHAIRLLDSYADVRLPASKLWTPDARRSGPSSSVTTTETAVSGEKPEAL